MGTDPEPVTEPLITEKQDVAVVAIEENGGVPEVEEPKENFIPFRLQDLRNRLITTFPEQFTPVNIPVFKQFVHRLTTFTKLRLSDEMEKTVDDYTWVDPDTDIQLPRDLSENEMEQKAMDFIDNKIPSILDDAGFLAVSDEDVEESKARKNDTGVEVKAPPQNYIYYKMYQRGKQKVEKTVRTWRTYYCKKTYIETEYRRLLVIFSLDDEVSAELRLSQNQTEHTKIMLSTEKVEKNEDSVQITLYAWWKFWRWCSGPKQITIKGMKPDMVYMKMFKDMQVGDIDQLVPGSQITFSLLDKLMIWVPVIFGFCMAVYKITKGHLDFQLWVHFLTTIFLVLFPLYYGYRAYSSTKLKSQQLRARLNELFLLHNLTNNSGVLSYLVEEAEEQEDKEILMAYFFLWKNGQQAMTKDELDRTVEDFLISTMQKYNITMTFDFDVADAVSDCVKMGLAYESEPGKYMAVNLPTALERIAVKNYSQK